MNFNDQQALAFVTGQAYKINQRVYETRYPDWDFGRLIYVDTTGPEWAPGVLTYTSDQTGRANWQSGHAKDVPLADVSQDYQTKNFHLAAIGYQWNIEEINTTMGFPGANLPDRRARAARLAYMKFMHNLTLTGSAEKGLGGLTNYNGVTATAAPADG
ncbi:MAG: major capsid family protein, partial [Kiritimatiellia bacterium]